jgi:hypothetical protein
VRRSCPTTTSKHKSRPYLIVNMPPNRTTCRDPLNGHITHDNLDLEAFRLQKGALMVGPQALACEQRIVSRDARVWLEETLQNGGRSDKAERKRCEDKDMVFPKIGDPSLVLLSIRIS